MVRKNVGKKLFLPCISCGYVQAVKSDEVWGCAKCKKLQLVDPRRARTNNQAGKVLCECRYDGCGHVQAVGGEVWVCYKCKRAQATATPKRRRKAGGRGRGEG